jgi:hypothetical protein
VIAYSLKSAHVGIAQGDRPSLGAGISELLQEPALGRHLYRKL